MTPVVNGGTIGTMGTPARRSSGVSQPGTGIAARIGAIEWPRVSQDLDDHGNAVIASLLGVRVPAGDEPALARAAEDPDDGVAMFIQIL